MDSKEWCAVVHVDIGSRVLDRVEQQLHKLTAADGSMPGTVEIVALQQPARINHFEVIGRFRSEAGYLEHVESPSNLAFRREIAALLGSPYEDRLHSPRGSQIWPSAIVGDAVVITQIEVRPTELAGAYELIDGLATAQRDANVLGGQVLLERHYRPNNLEIISTWPSLEAFEEYRSLPRTQSTRAALTSSLLAPLDDRQYQLVAGKWSVP